MVYRDPETGEFRSHDDDEPLDLTYADHEFLNFQLSTRVSPPDDDYGNTSGGEGSPESAIEYKVDDSILGLENDELGMLAWLDTSLAGAVTNFNTADATKGTAQVSAEIGANLSGQEYLGRGGADGIREVDKPFSNYTSRLKANAHDDPGLWSMLNVAVQSGYKDDDSSGDYSGNGAPDSDRQRRVLYEETSGGPYIDSTDDISIQIHPVFHDAEVDLQLELTGQMAFVVFEYENRRAEFAPYDPGPMP